MTTLRRLALAVALITVAAGRAPAQLVSNRSIHDELKVTPEQARKLDALGQTMTAESRERARKLRDLPAEERRKASQENFPRIWDDMHRRLGEILSPEQVKRYEQISIQNTGFAAFTMLPPVQERLKFTEEQRVKIGEIRDDLARMGGPTAAIQKRFQDDPVGERKRMDEATKEAIAKVVALMTDEQKKTWADLTGPPFRVKFERPPAP